MTDNINKINKKRILGIDLGEKRTGIAVTDATGILACGLEMIVSTGLTDCAKQVAAYTDKYDIEEIVVGNPINMNGTKGDSVKRSEKFIEILGGLLSKTDKTQGIKITLFDERCSTSLAHVYMNETGISGKKRKNTVDILSAQIILQNYIDGTRGCFIKR